MYQELPTPFAAWRAGKTAWEIVAGTPVPYIAGTIIIIIATSLLSALFPTPLPDTFPPPPGYFKHVGILFVASILMNFVTGPLWLGLFKMGLNGARRQPVSLNDLFAGLHHFLSSLVAGMLLCLFCAAGFIIFLPLGILVAIQGFIAQSRPMFVLGTTAGFGFALLCAIPAIMLLTPSFFFIIDYGLGPIAALKASARMVRGETKIWSRVWAVISFGHLLGMLTCCVGLIVVLPWQFVVLALAYEHERRKVVPEPAPPPLPQM